MPTNCTVCYFGSLDPNDEQKFHKSLEEKNTQQLLSNSYSTDIAKVQCNTMNQVPEPTSGRAPLPQQQWTVATSSLLHRCAEPQLPILVVQQRVFQLSGIPPGAQHIVMSCVMNSPFTCNSIKFLLNKWHKAIAQTINKNLVGAIVLSLAL